MASVAQGGPFSTAIQKATGTGSAHADPPQIATAAGDVVVIMGGAAHATAGVTFTAPVNYTTNAEPGTAGTDTISAGAGMAYRASGYANPEDPGAHCQCFHAAGDLNAVTLALKEAPAAVPFPIFHVPDRSIYLWSYDMFDGGQDRLQPEKHRHTDPRRVAR